MTMGLEPHYARLKGAWLKGNRDREAALNLMFHAWMHWADPSFVTGLNDDPDALRIWHEIYDHFGGTEASDDEFLFVAQIMATVTPWALGDESVWSHKAAALSQRLKALRSSMLEPTIFEGRGEYGRYFAHQIRSAQALRTTTKRHDCSAL